MYTFLGFTGKDRDLEIPCFFLGGGGGGESLSFEAETDTETKEIDQGQDPGTTTLTQIITFF